MRILLSFFVGVLFLKAQDLALNDKINSPILAIELTDGLSVSERERNILHTIASSITEIEEMIFSPNTQIMCIKLSENQKKFTHYSELLKHFYDFFNARSYMLMKKDHAMEIFDKYHHAEANIEKINIK